MATAESRNRVAKPQLRTDWWSTLLISIFIALCVTSVLPRASSSTELNVGDQALKNSLSSRYGPTKFSTNLEEWIIRDYFQDRRDGVFIDVGAYQWREASNTYVLERDLGWSGLAVDALSDYAEGYRIHRPRTRYVTAFVGDIDGNEQTLYFTDKDPRVSSVSRAFTSLFGEPTRTVQTRTARLDTLLEEAGIEKVDLLTMDIELSEPTALRGLSLERYAPQLVCIEAHTPVRAFILDYFARRGYVVVGKYLRIDGKNLYFRKLPQDPPAVPAASAESEHDH